ncbi:MAG TPA: trypsin-like serine protease [Labilithrix sp.]|nr:trypsin-like serine protease [Labilithrix sp.]
MSLALTHSNPPANATRAYKVGGVEWIVRRSAWVPAALVLSAIMGCAAEPSGPAVEARITSGSAAPTIFGGSKDDGDQAVPGVVALRVGTGGTFELCSGALIAPNVVLTARHCVTKNITTSVSCDENGHSANGLHVSGDEDPSTIGVYLGESPSFARRPAAVARAIIAPTGPYLCDSDIALVVLDSPITTVAPLPVRIHSPARAGETIRSVGYGQNDSAQPIGTRFRKGGVEVLAQGKAVSASKTPLGTHEFEVGKSICQGDSGGPALSEETGAVIGVVSRGGHCDEDFGHIYTTTAGFEALFDDAFLLAGASPTLEPGDVAVSPQAQVSSSKSTSDGGASGSAASCAMSPTPGAGSAGLALAVAALAALGMRRRRAV